MNRLMILILLAAQASAAGCAMFSGSRPVVTRRYAAYDTARDEKPRVRITVFAVPVPATPPAQTAITALGAEAQAELVKVMADRTKDQGPQVLAHALATPIRTASAPPSFRDLTLISRRLVFSLDNPAGGPATRISEARIYVRPQDSTRFVSWNRIENVYETVDIGKLSLSQERSASAELGLALPLLSAAPGVSGSAGSTLQEEIQLRQRRTVLTGTLAPREAILLQQGGTGIDLTGNVTADIDLVVPRGGDRTVFIPSLPASCVQPSFTRQTIRYPAGPRPAAPGGSGDAAPGPAAIHLSVELQYTVRDVPGGHATLTEGDDSVVFRTGTSHADSVVVVPGEALRFSVFELRMNDSTVSIQGATQSGTLDRIAPLQFGTFEDAAAMLAWIRRCEIPAVSFPLLLGTRVLTDGEEKRMYVWRTPVNYIGEGEESPLRR